MKYWLFFLSVGLGACVNALSPVDFDNLHRSEQLDLLIYNSIDGGDAGSPIRAFARGAFCSIDAVLSRQDASSVNTYGAIACKTVKP